jgi:hypothetical protein
MILIFKHDNSKKGIRKVEEISEDRLIRMSEIEDSYPGYKISDITFNICDDTHVYLVKEESRIK